MSQAGRFLACCGQSLTQNGHHPVAERARGDRFCGYGKESVNDRIQKYRSQT
jgi:hypothetical protein